MIRPAVMLFSQTLVEIGKALQAKGVTLDEIIEGGRDLRGNMI